mmetsp:Transcript_917/g.3824  ORF Transcript_917/g.3824 Transcript_917/m.3824 type:complete len:109 (+) Transcript_917:157-483(+)
MHGSSRAATALRAGRLLSQRTASLATASKDKQHIVVLGAGWAGFMLAKYLDKRKFAVTVVSPRYPRRAPDGGHAGLLSHFAPGTTSSSRRCCPALLLARWNFDASKSP